MRGGRPYVGSSSGRGRGRGDGRNRSQIRSPSHKHGPPRRISPIPNRCGRPRSKSPIFNRRASRLSRSPLSDKHGPPRDFSPLPDRRGPPRFSPLDKQEPWKNISPDGLGQPRNFSPLPITHGPPRNTAPTPNHSRHFPPRSLSPIPNRHVHRRSLSPITVRGGPLRNFNTFSNRRGPQRDRSPVPSIHRRSPSIGEQHRDMGYIARRSHQTVDPYNFQQHEKYTFVDHVNDLSTSKIVKDKDFIGSSSSLVQESLYMEDGSKRTFYTLPDVPKYPYDGSTVLNPSETVRSNGKAIYDQLSRNPYNSTSSIIGTSASSPSFVNSTDMSKLYGKPLPHNGFNQASQLSNHLMEVPVGPHGSCEEHARRERNSNDKSFSDFKDSIDRGDAYSLDRPHSRQRDTTMDFCDLKGIDKDYIGASSSGNVGYGLKKFREHEVPPIGDRYQLERGMGPVVYNERHDRPSFVDRDMDMYGHDMSPSRQKIMMELDGYNLPHEGLLRREYIISSNEPGGRSVHRRARSPIHGNSETWVHENHDYTEPRNVFKRIGSPIHPDEDDMWIHDEHETIYDRRRYVSPRRTDFRRSRIDSQLENDRKHSIKERLRPAPFIPEKRQKISKSQKTLKQGLEHRNYNEISSYSEKIHVKNDPPENSEEFKLQVHKAFLRFSKLLNESWHQQKKYKDDNQRKTTNLSCSVCGRSSKEFTDIHCLLCHSYHSLKVGLRTEHMGFHKALCVLNGWDWLVVPDPSYSYKQSIPSEIKALKEDLILWPPIVVIRNSSIGHRSTNGSKVVSVERMEEMLEGMGFDAGKMKVARGWPADQSVLLVKFMPTFSGLQEAEKLHKYYADNNRGREGLKQIKSSKNEVAHEKDEDVLYGYMGVAEDLDKLDPETKRRSLVKSRKDIDAIADAPID